MNKIKKFKQAIDRSQKIVFFSGAGMSTESGIADFRSAEGIYMTQVNRSYRPEEIVSAHFLETYPVDFFDYYFKYLVNPQAVPNAGHHFIANLEKQGKEVTVITQNIDGLHQATGSRQVLELHGSVQKNYCQAHHHQYTYDQLQLDVSGVPRCPQDGSLVRPDVVLYGESLPIQVLEAAIETIHQADLLVILGTSLVVYPAAGLINYFEGDMYVVINKTPISIQRSGGIIFEDSISRIFHQVESLTESQ